jgi:TIR domain/Pentapeptide repeats (8 copies)
VQTNSTIQCRRKSKVTQEHADIRPNLSDADLRDADLSGANLSGTKLINAKLYHADLLGANLSGADLYNADLSRANLSGAGLSRANLSDADLYDANLYDANLSDADLSKANLYDANLSDADLSRVDLKGVILWDTTFANVDLRSVKGLVEVYHQGPSIVQLHTVQLPQDGSAAHFLRGTGLPDEWIDFYWASMMHPIVYHSVFISYSDEDEDIAKRLHADLQNRGVRCWFALHDLKPGDYFRKGIDEAIHKQEKFLLILSEHSVNSGWVTYEVELALSREIKEERSILFPIRLDQAVMTTPKTWAVSLRDTRHIGDFTLWERHNEYQQAFTRLLRDLKAESQKGK